MSAYTQAYDAKGFFTGVRSRVTIHKPAAVVYQSLSTNLHHVFTPVTVLLLFCLRSHATSMLTQTLASRLACCAQVCDDTVEEDDGQGNQTIFRIVRVPFRVVFVSGNLKLRFRVTQSRQDGKVGT